MNPKVADRGASFNGAGQYYLHDKDADTSERVAFTHTENLITSDPDKAIKCMAWTAMHQKELKQNAGLSLKGNHGCKKPVYSYSLAWHPEQDPTKEQMIEAATSSLKFLGLQEHEALMVSHDDTEHPHIHVIVNLVHPVNGKTAKYRDDYKRFSRWAQAYQEERGETYSPQREKNNKRRDSGEIVKNEPDNLYDWRRKRQAENFERRLRNREDLSDEQKDRRIDLFRAKENLIEQESTQTREESRREWRELYKKQEQEKARLLQEQHDRKDKLDAVVKNKSGKVLQGPDEKRKGFLSGFFKDTSAKTIPDNPEKAKKKQIKERRIAQKERAEDLDKLLKDKNAVSRTGNRASKLARYFGDKTNRSKSDIARDEKEVADKKHGERLKEQRENDAALKRFLKNKKALQLNDKERTGKLSKSYSGKADDNSPAGKLNTTQEQRLLAKIEKMKAVRSASKKAEDKDRRAGQFTRSTELKKITSNKDALHREGDQKDKLTGVFGDHTNRSKDDIANDKRHAANHERQERAVQQRDDDHDLKRSLENTDRLGFDNDGRKGKLSKPFSNRAEDKNIDGDRKGPDQILNHPLRTPSLSDDAEDRKITWKFIDPKTGKYSAVDIGMKTVTLSDALIARREKQRAEAAKADKSKSKNIDPPHKQQLSDPEQLDKQHTEQRKALGKKIKNKQNAKTKEITELYKKHLQALKQEQAEQKHQLADKQSKESQNAARDIKDGRDIDEFNQETKYSAFREMKDEITRDLDGRDDSKNDGPDRSLKGPGDPKFDK